MAEYGKAERKHYEEWLKKEETTLVDALLILNETYSNESRELSNVALLNNLVRKEIPYRSDLIFPYHSTLLSNIKEIVSLILSNKIRTLKKSTSFFRFEFRYYFNETFLNRFLEDSKVLLETTVKPIDFVTQLLEHKNILPDELQQLIVPIKQDPAPNPKDQPSKSASKSKPLDPREETSVFLVLFTAVDHYKYDPKAKKNTATKTIMKSMERKGHHRSLATIKRILDKAARIAEEELNPKNKSL